VQKREEQYCTSFSIFESFKTVQMTKICTLCHKISDAKIWTNCSSKNLIKNDKQQFYCKDCSKDAINYYSNSACDVRINDKIILFTKEGLDIRSIARVLQISARTVFK
jgi:hypothetical protein